MDQCYSKMKHSPLPLFFQSHIYIYLHNTVVLVIMTKHLVCLGLTEHNHTFFSQSLLLLLLLLLLLFFYHFFCF